jgi:hypothetical protein
VVEDVNVHTKFERSRRPGQPGQKIAAAAPLPVLIILDNFFRRSS